jgi:hypothetical protein
MEGNQPTTGKYALNFGLITGAVGVVFGVMLYTMDMHYERGWAVQGTQVAILAAGIIFGIIQFKKANAGFLTLSEALKLGAGIGLIAALLGLAYFFILSSVIEPEYMDKVFEIGKQQAMVDNPKITEEQMDQSIEMQKKFAWVSYPIIIIMNIVIGLIVGLIGGLIMKKQNSEN